MNHPPLRILELSTYDNHGGAARACWQLFQGFRRRGHVACIAAGRKLSDDPDVFQIHPDGPAIERPFAQDDCCDPAQRLQRRADVEAGLEDFRFPASRAVLERMQPPPQVVHAHNLHGGYFDLSWLPELSARVPTVLSLHDAWLLSGNCAHSFDCPRWETGCGQCPNLLIYPGLKADGTAANWLRKRAIHAASRLRVSTPCHWLADKVRRSILAPGVVEQRVIPYGLDLSVFRPASRSQARLALGLDGQGQGEQELVFLFTADGLRGNLWKDFKMLREAVRLFAAAGRRVLFLALGDSAPEEQLGGARIRYIPFERDMRRVALFFQAADIYIHAARADTFPFVVLEALACGTPVVATAVGGIPEQVKGLQGLPGADPLARWSAEEATGALAPPGDAEAMARILAALADDPSLLGRLSRNAAQDAAARFDIERELGDYLDWYGEMIEQDQAWRRAASAPQANGQPSRPPCD